MDEFKGDEPLDPVEALDAEVDDEMEGMHIDGEVEGVVAEDDEEVVPPIETDL